MLRPDANGEDADAESPGSSIPPIVSFSSSYPISSWSFHSHSGRELLPEDSHPPPPTPPALIGLSLCADPPPIGGGDPGGGGDTDQLSGVPRPSREASTLPLLQAPPLSLIATGVR
ncbi:unnamed protein product, partial [Ectocarpus sp. 8 AP-2014]